MSMYTMAIAKCLAVVKVFLKKDSILISILISSCSHKKLEKFYTAGQLRSWIIEQQMMNNEKDYG